MSFKKEGFDAERHTGVVLDAGTEAVLDVQLKVGSVSTTVEVTGGAPILEPSRVALGLTIDHAQVDNLPLTSRNPYNFVIFQPGLSGHPNRGVRHSAHAQHERLAGSHQLSNGRHGGYRDGPLRFAAVRDFGHLRARSADRIQQLCAGVRQHRGRYFQRHHQLRDQLRFNGEFYFIGRPPDAVARPILLASNKPAPSIDLHDYALNSGGPIKKDRVFIFGGYEHLLRGTPTPVTIDPTAAAQIGIPPSQLATAPTVQHVQFLNLRVDWNINQKNQIFFRYNYFRNNYPFNTNNGGLNALSVGVDFIDRAHVGGLQLISTLSPTAVNEFRASEPYRNEHHVADPITGTGPEITITGIASFGGTNAAGDRYGEKIPSFSDNFTKIKGAHTIKAGFGWQLNNDNQIGDVYSQYTFPSIASYLAAKSGANPLALFNLRDCVRRARSFL